MEITPIVTETLAIDSPEEFISLFGIREENLSLFREELGVEIFAHGNEVKLTGEPERSSFPR